MKRIWKISDSISQNSQSNFIPKTLTTRFNLTRNNCSVPPDTTSSSGPSSYFTDLFKLFSDRWVDDRAAAREKVSSLKDELVTEVGCGGGGNVVVERFLDEKVWDLARTYRDGSVVVELLQALESEPQLAMEVVNWRRKSEHGRNPMTSEEYAKCIKVAGRMKNIDLAEELFREASNKRVKTSSTYNALMGAYMCNGLSDKCQSLFRDFKREVSLSPTVVTYNILISIFGRVVQVDQMEAIFQEMNDSNVSPNLGTYNNLIAGYLTAWMWDSMDRVYMIMKESPVSPSIYTHLLMLRGYAYSNNLEKMEEIYALVEDHMKHNEIPLLRSMICAYCRSRDRSRIQKIESLMRIIPENEYRPWLNVLLIRVYAQEHLVDGMERYIDEAFKRNTSVHTTKIMRSIISSYFRNNSSEKLANFVKQAEEAGWKNCRSLYHCMMTMYGLENRLDLMESVLDQMEKVNLECNKRTFWILFKAYSLWDQKTKLERIITLMCKYGYGVPTPAYLS